MAAETQWSRRRFLQFSFTAGGALLIGIDLAGCSGHTSAHRRLPSSSSTTVRAHEAELAFAPNLFVRIDPDDSVTLTVHRSEMGQGVRTALAMIIADELEVDWSRVKTVQSPANKAIGEQLTSGSGSVTGSYQLLREAGATARDMLVSAAAKTWGVAPSQCEARDGAVVRVATGERRTYGSLVRVAAGLKVPPVATLKDPKHFRLIGTSVPRVEQPAIVSGRAEYGLDVRVPNMMFAAVARCPVPGGTLTSYDDTAAKRIPGVRAVVRITHGVAVVADSSWTAFRGRDALVTHWDEGPLAKWSRASIDTALSDTLQPLVQSEGPLGPRMLEAVYDTPYLAHAPMEPLSCVADVGPRHCEVWCPTQNPQAVQSYIADAIGVPTEVHVTMIGGGFGRRLEVDFALEAAETSKAVGAAVQVTWTRTDDLQHDYYRPPSRHWMRAGWDAGSNVTLWRHVVVGPGLHGVVYQVGRDLLLDGLSVQYNVADADTDAEVADIALPTGPWRAVLDGPNAFANECFLDEVATAIHQDPLALRMKLLPESDLMRPVLALAASKARWEPAASGQVGRGIACHTRAETPVAMVADVSLDAGVVRVHKVVCAVDCGTVINPDMVVQQIEGGVVFGLTSMLKDPITFDQGRVQQHNFDDYRLLQMSEMPVVEVHIVPSTRDPQGVGEMGVPPIVPAVANALFTLTGTRVRSTPLSTAG